MSMSFNYMLGLFFIAIVAILGSAFSVLIQYLYVDLSFHSPFMVTYICNSLSSLWLPVNLALTTLTNLCCGDRFSQKQCTPSVAERSAGADITRIICANGSFVETITAAVTSYNLDEAGLTEKLLKSADFDETSLVDLVGTESHDFVQDETLPLLNQHHHRHQHHPWTHSDYFRAAFFIAPVWFSSNWMYFKSLQFTSITSSNVLAVSGSSMLTFLLAVLIGDEVFGWTKVGGILFGVAGSILTEWNDRSVSDTNAAESTSLNMTLSSSFADTNATTDTTSAQWGDLLGFLSAVGQCSYTLQFRILCPHDESLFSMQLLLGYIGLICMVGFSPCVVWQILEGNNSGGHIHLTWVIFGSLVVKGVFDCILNYLWFRAVILTSATVATVGWGLIIPMAIACDVFFWGKTSVLTLYSILGCLSCLLCFVLVSMGSEDRNAISQVIEVNTNTVVGSNESLQNDDVISSYEPLTVQLANN